MRVDVTKVDDVTKMDKVVTDRARYFRKKDKKISK
jgi:hypothetical protein